MGLITTDHVQAPDEDLADAVLTWEEANQIRSALACVIGYLESKAEDARHQWNPIPGTQIDRRALEHAVAMTLAYNIVKTAHDKRG